MRRWLNRDPIGEDGGLNLQRFARNRPVGIVDYRGLIPISVLLPDIDRDFACCKYRRTRGSAGTGGAAVHTTTEFETTGCFYGKCRFKSPKSCCKCTRSKRGSFWNWGVIDVRSLKDARWGPCCYCTVKLVRERFITNPLGAHHWLVVSCPGRTRAIHIIPDGDPKALKPYHAPVYLDRVDPDAPVTIGQFRTSCKDKDKIFAVLEFWDRMETYPYVWPYVQCRTFARMIYNSLKGYRDPFYDEE